MTAINLAGIAVYFLVVALCAAAAWAASGPRHRGRHVAAWLGCALAFSLLTLVRLFTIDDHIELALKLFAKATGVHDDRAMLQVPLVGLAILGAAVLTLFAAKVLHSHHPDRRDRLIAVALFSTVAFAPLYALRLISWHDLDAILYSGGIHLNWLFELALCSLVAGSATLYIRATKTHEFAAAPGIRGGRGLRRGPARRDRR